MFVYGLLLKQGRALVKPVPLRLRRLSPEKRRVMRVDHLESLDRPLCLVNKRGVGIKL